MKESNYLFSGVQSSISHFVEIFTSTVITRQSNLLQPLTVELRALLLGLEFLEANSPLNFGNFPRPIVPGSVPGNSMNKQNNFQTKNISHQLLYKSFNLLEPFLA